MCLPAVRMVKFKKQLNEESKQWAESFAASFTSCLLFVNDQKH